MMKILQHIIMFFTFMCASVVVSAAVQPPPVNQNIGIPDTSFNFFDESLCKSCHHAAQNDEDPLNNAPVNRGYNPDRHHLSVGQPIDGRPDFPPFRDADYDGVNDSVFTCYNCHIIVTNIETGELELVDNFRNCSNCHQRQEGETTVHHATERAQQGNCFQCHGGIVRGINVETLEGKRPDFVNIGQTVPVSIPDYRTGIITPWRSKKPIADDSIVNSAGVHPGNCNFCHNTADGMTGGTDEPLKLPDGRIITVKIFTNEQNHHNTGFFNEGKCVWCHNLDGENIEESAEDIRVCQRCHDRSTIHNIEFDAIGDGIDPGKEEPYFGHIGHNDNCWGCHGFSREKALEEIANQSSNGVTDVIIPTLTSLSQRVISSGSEVLITASGNSFVNSMETTGSDGTLMEFSWKSKVVLTDKKGQQTIIEPVTQNETTLEFILPGNQPIGFYEVSLQKSYQVSNPLGLVVVPTMLSDNAFIYMPYGPFVFISGTGFTNASGMYDVKGSNTSLVDQDGNSPAIIYIWRNDLIIAYFYDYPESVTITNVFGEKTFVLDRFE